MEPYLATSEDQGRTWQRKDISLAKPASADLFWVESLIFDEGKYYAFYHCHRPDQPFENHESWRMGAAVSEDMEQWEHVEAELPDWHVTGHALTNPCVVKAEGAFYMVASEYLARNSYRLRLFKASRALGPYRDLGVIVDLDEAPWCALGCWDAELLRLDDGWALFFAGRDSPDHGPTHYGLAYADRVAGDYRVEPEPAFSRRHSGRVQQRPSYRGF
jgi:hypothetical protein